MIEFFTQQEKGESEGQLKGKYFGFLIINLVSSSSSFSFSSKCQSHSAFSAEQNYSQRFRGNISLKL